VFFEVRRSDRRPVQIRAAQDFVDKKTRDERLHIVQNFWLANASRRAATGSHARSGRQS